MRKIHIVGRRNSGKTTLIRELIPYFASLGMRVGTIKHTHHHHELDTPGKDSCLHRQAGAAVVGIISRGMQAVFIPHPPSQEVFDPYAEMSPSFENCDLVLVEGDWEAQAIKVEVWRAGSHSLPVAIERSDIAAVVSDDPLACDLPCWPRSDVPNIGQNLIHLALGKTSLPSRQHAYGTER